MKLTHPSTTASLVFCWCLIGISIVNSASAWSPSSPIGIASTASALWTRKGASRNASQTTTSILQSSQSDTETTTNIMEVDAAISPNATVSTTTKSQVTAKAAAILTSVASSSTTFLSSSQVQSAASVFGGCLLTYYLNNFTPLGPVKASSVVGIVASLALPLPLALAAFCGSFAGMAKSSVIPASGPSSVALGVVCAGVMALFDKRKWLVGVGGRLGFIAQCACTLQFVVSSLVLRQPLVSSTAGAATLVGNFGDPVKILSQLPAVCLSTVAGALFMSFWKEALTEQSQQKKNDATKAQIYNKLSTSVAASGVTGLLAALLFPPSVAGPAFCGSFIAMSAPAKLETYGSLIGASLMGGVCQQAMSGVLLGGWGGRLGTAALCGVLSYKFLMSLPGKSLRQAVATKST